MPIAGATAYSANKYGLVEMIQSIKVRIKKNQYQDYQSNYSHELLNKVALCSLTKRTLKCATQPGYIVAMQLG